MISSEVQRTLVKSPPELWAEISDPDSLARHLGEFGEIRITRVQPEQKVEWETDEASGSVVIKPSGWGTKVKLTVTRELPEIAAPEPVDEPCITPDGESEPALADELESDVDDEAALALEPDLAAEHDVLGPDADPEPLADGPADELEASEEIAPTLADEHEQDLESEYELDEEPEPVAAERVAMTDPEPLPEPEPRRGFFARLFGRRRTARATEPMSEHAADAEADEELSAAHPDAPAAEPYETISDWEAEVERDGEPQLDANDEVEDQTQPDAVHEPEPEPMRAPELEADGEPTLEAGLDARAQLEPIDAAEAVELPSSASAGEQPAEAPAAHDIAAELEAAEAIAAEQVTAVLTGVLDRLGAAHHRPFSRA
jgi:hypothetical protein